MQIASQLNKHVIIPLCPQGLCDALVQITCLINSSKCVRVYGVTILSSDEGANQHQYSVVISPVGVHVTSQMKCIM